MKYYFIALGTLSFTLSMSCIGHAKTISHLQQSNGVTLITDQANKYRGLKVEKVNIYPDSNVHAYSNYGANEAAVAPSQSHNKNAFDPIIQQAAQTYGISAGLIKAIMHTESGFNTRARSPVGAQGLMQLMPATAKRFNVSNAYDPQQNIMGAARYLAWLTKRFNGDTSLILAGYNAGEGNVKKYGGIPPFRETQDYVRRVKSRYQNLYAGGLSVSKNNQLTASTSTQNAKSVSTTQTASVKTPSVQRQIVESAPGVFTDKPNTSGSYSNGHAFASASITISN